jgi:hypothetical protein
LVLEIPFGFLGDDEEKIQSYGIYVDGQPAGGSWGFLHRYPNREPDWEYYEWQWEKPIVSEGEFELTVRSQQFGELLFGKRRSQKVRIVHPTDDNMWPDPSQLGKFWIWTLLAQIQHEPNWEEFWIARMAVSYLQHVTINQNDWKKLDDHGYVKLRRQFMILKSAIKFELSEGAECVAHFAGLPDRLYSLVQKVKPVKPIKVVEERGLPPCLEIVWPAHQRQFIRSVCPQARITVVDKLWNR